VAGAGGASGSAGAAGESGASGSGGVPTGGTGGSGGTITVTPANPNQTTVSVAKSTAANASELTQAQVRDLVRQAVALAGGLDTVVAPNDVVVLKPNLVRMADYYGDTDGAPLSVQANGVATDWRVTAAVAELVLEQSPSAVYVMEGSTQDSAVVFDALGYTTANFTGATAVTGILGIAADSGAWQDTSSAGLIAVTVPGALLTDRNPYYYNRRYYEANVVISLPVLKTHWHAVVTGGVKNLGIGATPSNIYGGSASAPWSRWWSLTGNPNAIQHTAGSPDLHRFIHDFYKGRPADFVVMDGLQGVENGPTPGDALYPVSGHTSLASDQKNLRLVLAGRDAVAVDTIESLIMEWDPRTVEYLQLLESSAVGTTNTANIRVVGERVDQVRVPFGSITSQFVYGGATITDFTPPVVTVTSHSMLGPYLMLSVAPTPDLTKLEVFASGALVEPPVSSGFGDIVLDLTALGAGTYDLVVRGYDYALNVTEQTFAGGIVVP
jgi:uncharacterized protein (DUF362 family)